MPTELKPTYDKAVLRELLERVEGAEGRLKLSAYEVDEWQRALGLETRDRPTIISALEVPSLDATLALVERFKSGIDAAQILHEVLEDMANGGWRDDRPLAPQICLYLLAALLRALSQEDGNAV